MKNKVQLERSISDGSLTVEEATVAWSLWGRRACLARAPFHTDPAIHFSAATATIFRLGKVSPEVLVETARYAAATQNQALASAVLDEVDYRVRLQTIQASQVKAIEQFIAAIVTDAEAILPLLHKVMKGNNGDGKGTR